MISPRVCTRHDWYDYKVQEPAMLCAGHAAGGKGTCTGDAGGPLQCMSSNGRWKLAGIKSWTDDCAQPRKPTVFTSIAFLVNWINKYTSGMYAAHFYRSPLSSHGVKIVILQITSFGFCLTRILSMLAIY